ncbi:MAG TPA: flavin reductase family protein [Dehalococcoidia bacterium]|nr:flavin reductase family protein [Dehalococcoidia bacterium]
MKINLSDEKAREMHHILMSIIAPRPIAWVSTVSEDGIYNLAPFSAFCVMSVNPAIVGFNSAAFRDGRKKDTLINIESNGEYVINMVDESLAEAMNITSASFPPQTDEFQEADLTTVKADLVKVPMVGESPVNLECRLRQILKFGEEPMTNNFIIGDVLLIHVKDEYYSNEEINASALKLIGRLGGRGIDRYCRTTDSFKMQRPV